MLRATFVVLVALTLTRCAAAPPPCVTPLSDLDVDKLRACCEEVRAGVFQCDRAFPRNTRGLP